jgi:lipopolysaccharide heptosyltransferase II
MQADLSWKNCRSILCVRPDNMGDVLMTTPAIRAVKESLPERHITLLTSSAGAAIAPFVPEIDEVITFDVPWVSTQISNGPQAIWDLVEQLQQGKFDGAMIFTVQSQNPLPAAMLCYMAGIPRILGYCRENPYRLLTNWVPDTEVLYATRHEVERQLALVAIIGCTTSSRKMSLTVTGTAQQQALQSLIDIGVDLQEPWLVLHAGVSEAKRQYSAQEYIRAARQLMNDYGYQIILTGSASERSYIENIRMALGEKAYNLAGLLSLETFIGLIAQAPVLISNNTGPVHMAAAVGTPVVVLYAMTNPQHTPWQVENRVLYFEVPPHLRSKNVLLQQFPGAAQPKASPDAIVEAVREISREKYSIQPQL